MPTGSTSLRWPSWRCPAVEGRGPCSPTLDSSFRLPAQRTKGWVDDHKFTVESLSSYHQQHKLFSQISSGTSVSHYRIIHCGTDINFCRQLLNPHVTLFLKGQFTPKSKIHIFLLTHSNIHLDCFSVVAEFCY